MRATPEEVAAAKEYAKVLEGRTFNANSVRNSPHVHVMVLAAELEAVERDLAASRKAYQDLQLEAWRPKYAVDGD